MSLTLTAKEIVDLAEFAGFSVNTYNATDELETEYTIQACPKNGVLDEDGTKSYHSEHIAYLSEYPEEGTLNLGKTEERKIEQPETDFETLSDLLALVSIQVSSGQISTWSNEQRQQAEQYASAVHLAASDNDCEVPEKPEFLPDETLGTGLWD